jgi:hypothetical protein
MLQHQVLVYEDDDGFVDAAGPFLQEGMERSEALLVISTASNNGMLKQKLGKSAAQVGFVEAETWYLSPVSAMNAYRKFLDEKLEQGAAWARIVGDPGWPGRSDDEIRLWNQYESLVNMAFSPSPLTVLCTYDERTVNAEIVAAARLTHPWVVEGRELIENPMYQDPGEFVFGDAHETRDQ